MCPDKQEQLRQLIGSDYDLWVLRRESKWEGPVSINALLADCLKKSVWPPTATGVYLVSQYEWKKWPEPECKPLYVGSTTGKGDRFLTRVGDLIVDMYGFFGGNTGHSTGGASVHKYCIETGVHPGSLYIGWIPNPKCRRCAELFVWDWFNDLDTTLLNRKRPPRCVDHKTPLIS